MSGCGRLVEGTAARPCSASPQPPSPIWRVHDPPSIRGATKRLGYLAGNHSLRGRSTALLHSHDHPLSGVSREAELTGESAPPCPLDPAL